MKKEEPVITICLSRSKGNPVGFDDNVYGTCASCGEEIFWRPHADDGPKFCIPCGIKAAEADGSEITVTEDTKRELRQHFGVVVEDED